jgi:formate C-acetyltransferase
LDSGKDITQGGITYYIHMTEMAGLSHAADSLAVIKKLCFEEKTVPLKELLDAIKNNWEGKDYLRQLVRTRAPAYGNDIDYVDDIASELVKFYAESVRKHSAKAPNNVKYTAALATFEQYTDLGRVVGATPDGRLAGQPLSSNGSPSIGRVENGQTAAVNSYAKLPLAELPGTSMLDLNVGARADLLQQLESFIKTFVNLRGNGVNIAVNDCEKLRAAQKEPEKYRDLKVRVGGYEAYFTDLPPNHQQMQIVRCEQYGG